VSYHEGDKGWSERQSCPIKIAQVIRAARFSWNNTPKRGKIYQNYHKIYQMAFKYTKYIAVK
jgi:hypothetical protein